jgi:hypothetical protein
MNIQVSLKSISELTEKLIILVISSTSNGLGMGEEILGDFISSKTFFLISFSLYRNTKNDFIEACFLFNVDFLNLLLICLK